MASKTSFIYGVVIFYTLIGLFVSLLGNMYIQNNMGEAPSLNLQNALSDSNKEIDDLNFCDSGISEDGKIVNFKNFLTPVFLRPNCITQKTLQAQNEYTSGILEDSYSGKESKFKFFPSIIVGMTLIPTWLNAIIFTPLVVAILFVLVTTIGGLIFDGGS